MMKKKKKARKVRSGLSKEIIEQIKAKEKEADEHEIKMLALMDEAKDLQYPERKDANKLSVAFKEKFDVMVKELKSQFEKFGFEDLAVSCNPDRDGSAIYFEFTNEAIYLKESDIDDDYDEEDEEDSDYDDEEDI